MPFSFSAFMKVSLQNLQEIIRYKLTGKWEDFTQCRTFNATKTFCRKKNKTLVNQKRILFSSSTFTFCFSGAAEVPLKSKPSLLCNTQPIKPKASAWKIHNYEIIHELQRKKYLLQETTWQHFQLQKTVKCCSIAISYIQIPRCRANLYICF